MAGLSGRDESAALSEKNLEESFFLDIDKSHYLVSQFTRHASLLTILREKLPKIMG